MEVLYLRNIIMNKLGKYIAHKFLMKFGTRTN